MGLSAVEVIVLEIVDDEPRTAGVARLDAQLREALEAAWNPFAAEPWAKTAERRGLELDEKRQVVRQLRAELARDRAELEQARCQLAGCSVAALGGRADVEPGDYGHSASLDDVKRIREELEAFRAGTIGTLVPQLRDRAERAEDANEGLAAELERTKRIAALDLTSKDRDVATIKRAFLRKHKRNRALLLELRVKDAELKRLEDEGGMLCERAERAEAEVARLKAQRPKRSPYLGTLAEYIPNPKGVTVIVTDGKLGNYTICQSTDAGTVPELLRGFADAFTPPGD